MDGAERTLCAAFSGLGNKAKEADEKYYHVFGPKCPAWRQQGLSRNWILDLTGLSAQ